MIQLIILCIILIGLGIICIVFNHLLIGVLIVLFTIFVVISYIVGDLHEKGVDDLGSVSKSVKASTNSEYELLRQELAMTHGIEEKLSIISKTNILDVSSAAYDLLDTDLNKEDRIKNSDLLVERKLLTEQEVRTYINKIRV